MPKLTRKAFRAWLMENPRRRFKRVVGDDYPWTGHCPIATFIGEPFGAFAKDPRWAREFAKCIDNETEEGFKLITAARCLKILDGIK